MQKYVKLLVLISIFFTNAFSQDAQKPKYWLGAGGFYSVGLNQASFEKFPRTPNCCEEFGSNIGSGLYLDAIFYKPLSGNYYLDTRLSFLNANSKFTETGAPIGNVISGNGGSPATTQAIVDHNLETSLMLLSLAPSISYEFPFKLKISAGLDLGYIISGNFEQSEELISPEGYVFANDQSLVRNVASNQEIPKLSAFQFGLSVGAGYKIEIGNERYIIPEVKYIHRFTDVSSVDWNINEIRFGIAYNHPVFEKRKLEIIRDTIINRDTTDIFVYKLDNEPIKLASRDITKRESFKNDEIDQEIVTINEVYTKQNLKKADITAEIEVYGLEHNGTKTKYPKIIIEETETEDAFPVLPYVFFKPNTAEFKDTKLISDIDDFQEDSLNPNVFDIYRNNLNVIASRVNKFNSQIELVSINPNIQNRATSKGILNKRIEKVKNYLVEDLGIKENLISAGFAEKNINSKGQDLEDLIAEANRVEIRTDDIDILKPVFIKRIERSANPPAIEIKQNINAEAGLKKWQTAVSQENQLLRSYNGDEKSKTLKWNIIQEPSPKLDKPITISLNVTDNVGNQKEAKESIQLNQLTLRKKRYELQNDKRIQRFSLIVFDYNSAELKPIHRKIIDEIKSRIKENSTIKIYGYADRVGEDNYNFELSRRRTENVRKQFESLPNKIEYEAFGNRELIYDNNSPEGRSLSRTVRIIIETPFKE